jgi:DUF4097 and DUF4098 domain-containing protein YvlB
MANPVMTPAPGPPQPPQPPLPPRPPRSIAGAIVLILLGIMFLLGTMGIVSGHGLAMFFSKFWPLLLILWGIVKLIEHEQAKRAEVQSRGIGVGGVFLMLFVIAAGLVATGVSHFNWGDLRDQLQIDDKDFDEIFGGSSFDYSGELGSDLPAGWTRLEINDDRGTVTLNVSDDKKIRVEWRKKVHAADQAAADRDNKKTDVTIAPAGNGVIVNANTLAVGKGISTDMDIYAPRNMEVIITSKHGDVDINGMGAGVQVTHQGGEVNISDLAGSAALTLDHSSARLQHVKGDVTIQGRANEVDVEDVDGAAHLNGEFMESVRLVRVTKTVGFHSSRTDMEFARLDGRLDLDSGDLRADSLFGPMRLSTRSKDVSLEGLSGDMRLQDENGTVDVGLQKPGNIQIDNRKGDVQIAIPPKTAIKVEARTREGEIQSDFEEIKIESGNKQASASGSIGTNGPRLAINCDKGDIEIRRGTVTVGPPAPPEPPSVPATPGKTKALPAPKAKPVESEN